ncbi:MAG: hypothetical protein NT01SARS_0442 [SAR86 cluster bacterium SAR86A]|uniref:Uncharacterized protein n=1 Tax=SAR86 cluster bacterium SAR86A TaxID=1123866 RepID=J4UZZ8_9GAMM|nr:MAG: hypothetical protein NT01SARS_0442 [SAR86 cluster bacterium SAR86A]
MTVRLSFEVISAIYAKDAGLVADPTRPFINLPSTRAGNSKVTLSKFFCAKKRGVINAIKDIEYPTSPRIAIFLLPYLSLVLPQNALVVAHAKADIAKIEEVCISLKPKSLARGGTRTKTND